MGAGEMSCNCEQEGVQNWFSFQFYKKHCAPSLPSLAEFELMAPLWASPSMKGHREERECVWRWVRERGVPELSSPQHSTDPLIRRDSTIMVIVQKRDEDEEQKVNLKRRIAMINTQSDWTSTISRVSSGITVHLGASVFGNIFSPHPLFFC